MSRPVCGACGELDVTSDPCRCHPPAPLDAAVEEAREALGEIPPNAEDTRITSLIRCAKALRSLLAALDADKRLEEAVREWVPALRKACVRVLPDTAEPWMWLALLGEARDAADALDAALAPPPEAEKKGGDVE